MLWKWFMQQRLRYTPSKTVANLVRYNARVNMIRVTDTKVFVNISGDARTVEADFCVSTIPMPIFAKLTTNLDPAVIQAATAIPGIPAGKVGWQAERFWEKETDIVGGISWVEGLADQVWYPSNGFLSKRGVLTGAYMFGPKAVTFNAKSIEERMAISRAAIDALHPGRGKLLKHGVAIAWERMEHLQMGFVDEESDGFKKFAPVVAAPQHNRLFQAGD